MATDKPGAEPEKPRYRPTERELAAMRKLIDRADAQPAPRLKADEEWRGGDQPGSSRRHRRRSAPGGGARDGGP